MRFEDKWASAGEGRVAGCDRSVASAPLETTLPATARWNPSGIPVAAVFATAVPWSVPAFLPGRSTVGTPFLRRRSLPSCHIPVFRERTDAGAEPFQSSTASRREVGKKSEGEAHRTGEFSSGPCIRVHHIIQ